MVIKRYVGALTAVGAILLSSPAPFAQTLSQRALQEKLTSAKSLKCDFTTMVTATWNKEGVAQAEVKPSTMSLQFLKVNIDEGSAEMKGEVGTYQLVVKLSESTLHFIHSFRAGALYTTTVFPKETHDGRFKAVHTRHEYVDIVLPGFTSRPEEYFGDCAVGP